MFEGIVIGLGRVVQWDPAPREARGEALLRLGRPGQAVGPLQSAVRLLEAAGRSAEGARALLEEAQLALEDQE